MRDGNLTPAEVDAMRADLEALDQLYARHIEFEDQVLFPAAARVVGAAQLHALGNEMAERRQLDLPKSPTAHH